MAIGKKLDAILRAKGKKPGTLASEIGISKNTIYAIIKRDNEKVDMSTLGKIAETLDISIDYFFERDIDTCLNKNEILSLAAFSKAALHLATLYDTLDPYSQALVRMVVEHEAKRGSSFNTSAERIAHAEEVLKKASPVGEAAPDEYSDIAQ